MSDMITDWIVCVTWRDAMGDDSAGLVSQFLGPAINRTCGWLQYEDGLKLVVAHEDSSTGEMNRSVILQDNILARVDWRAGKGGWFDELA